MKGEKLKGALSRGPKEKPTERLSPGVYRGSKGGLVGQRGQAIQRQAPPPQQMGGNFTGPQNDLVSRTPLPPGMTSQGFAQMIAGQPVQDMMYRYSPEEAARMVQNPIFNQISSPQMPQQQQQIPTRQQMLRKY